MLKGILSIALLASSLFVASHNSVAFTNDVNTNTAPEQSVSSSHSANWSGYVADSAGTYSAVSGTWVVPAPSGTSNTRLSTDASWVGIGGVKNKDLIQAGTQAFVQNGRVSYEAWYEILPDYQVVIPLVVHASDSVSVSLNETSASLWHLTFINNSTGKSYAKDIAYTSSRSSAEWIEEMPVVSGGRGLTYVPLDNFGTVTFTNAYATKDGTNQSVAALGAGALTMVTNGRQTLASPSALASNSSFSISRSNTTTTVQPVQQFALTNRSTHRHYYVGGGGGQIIVRIFSL